jgi:adenosylcobinamide-phosphate synthase
MEKGAEMDLGLAILLLAVTFDLFVGEQPANIHPVVWIGKLISFVQSHAKQTYSHGFLLSIIVISITILSGSILVWIAGHIAFFGTLVAAYLLKSTFALRCLIQTSSDIGKMIDQDLSKARDMLPALVGRDVKNLTKPQAASAVIESLSENFVDTLISPIFFFMLFEPLGFGLQAALGFKAVSTMDSMLGYKNKDLKELGFAPARMDDLANFVPARLSIFFIALAQPNKAKMAMSTAFRYHNATPSPNSGWPMSACAGSIGVRLEKPGYYILLDVGKEPDTSDIRSALELISLASALTIGIAALFLL